MTDFAQSLNADSNINYVWKRFKTLKNKWAKINSDIKTIPNLPLKIHKASLRVAPPICSVPENLTVPINNHILDAPFTFSEFNLALKRCKVNSVPGLDAIEIAAIVGLSLRIKLILLDILNSLYINKIFPPFVE
ncbi:hypothetical protein P5V15_012793 [Pogonomyrmex californicus]